MKRGEASTPHLAGPDGRGFRGPSRRLPGPWPPGPPLASKALLAAAVGTLGPITGATNEAGDVQAAFLWQDRTPGEKAQRLQWGQHARDNKVDDLQALDGNLSPGSEPLERPMNARMVLGMKAFS